MIIFVGQEKLNKFSLFPQIFVEYSQNIFIASIVYENMFMFDVERSGHDTCYWDAGQAGWAVWMDTARSLDQTCFSSNIITSSSDLPSTVF